MAGSFLKQIKAKREAATQPASPAQKPPSEMSPEELDAAIEQAKRDVLEAERAAAAAAEANRPSTSLSQVLGGLQRGKRRHWR